MQHEPCGLLSDLQIAGEFIRANPVLAIDEQPHCGKPLVQANGGILKDSSNFDGELPLGMVTTALPDTPRCVVLHFARPASWTDNTVRPTAASKIISAVVEIREINNCFLKAFGT